MLKVRTILYAEDDVTGLKAYQNGLEQAGYLVIPARDGREAMKKLAAFVPDLVLLDLMQPEFNGEEVLRLVRNNAALIKVPVIVLSTNSILDAAQEHLLERPCKRLIKSHCTPATLLAAIEEALTGVAVEPIAVSFSAVLQAATA